MFFQNFASSQFRNDYPWLWGMLELHYRACNADCHRLEAFMVSGNVVECEKCGEPIANWKTERKSKQTVGVIGFGSFGQFLSKHLSRAFHHITVTDTERRYTEAAQLNVNWGSLEAAAARDIVILAVPLQSLEAVLKGIAGVIRPGGLVIDVCSVKQQPLKLMRQYVPTSAGILGTHPLFGPQSAKDNLFGHRIVFCPERLDPSRLIRIASLLADGFGLQVLIRDAETHDREMAVVQALAHFVVRGLAGCGIQQSELTTIAFNKLHEAVELLGGDSWELFQTIENGNPYAAEVRARFMSKLAEIERRLKE